jgi:hypothetical protein
MCMQVMFKLRITQCPLSEDPKTDFWNSKALTRNDLSFEEQLAMLEDVNAYD